MPLLPQVLMPSLAVQQRMAQLVDWEGVDMAVVDLPEEAEALEAALKEVVRAAVMAATAQTVQTLVAHYR